MKIITAILIYILFFISAFLYYNKVKTQEAQQQINTKINVLKLSLQIQHQVKPLIIKKTKSKNINPDYAAKLKRDSIYYIAKTLYFEAQVTTYEDRCAIAQVILNRVKDSRFPHTVKEVVKQDSQFSCYNTKTGQQNLNSNIWVECLRIANNAINGALPNTVGNALFYHASYVDPFWAKDMIKVGQFVHIFYEG